MTDRPLQIAIVNDYELVVRGLASMLSNYPSDVHVVELDAHENPDRRVDVALFDTFGCTELAAVERCTTMKAQGFADHVVLYSWHLGPGARRRAAAAGADAVVLKSEPSDRLVNAMQRVALGERLGFDTEDTTGDAFELTVREREILGLMAIGRTNHEIARSLFVSEETVKTYAKRLFRKLGVRNRVEASIRASELGFASPV